MKIRWLEDTPFGAAGEVAEVRHDPLNRPILKLLAGAMLEGKAVFDGETPLTQVEAFEMDRLLDPNSRVGGGKESARHYREMVAVVRYFEFAPRKYR